MISWTLFVCPECGSAVSEDAASCGVPPEFMTYCRHPVSRSVEVGRKVARVQIEVVNVENYRVEALSDEDREDPRYRHLRGRKRQEAIREGNQRAGGTTTVGRREGIEFDERFTVGKRWEIEFDEHQEVLRIWSAAEDGCGDSMGPELASPTEVGEFVDDLREAAVKWFGASR